MPPSLPSNSEPPALTGSAGVPQHHYSVQPTYMYQHIPQQHIHPHYHPQQHHLQHVTQYSPSLYQQQQCHDVQHPSQQPLPQSTEAEGSLDDSLTDMSWVHHVNPGRHDCLSTPMKAKPVRAQLADLAKSEDVTEVVDASKTDKYDKEKPDFSYSRLIMAVIALSPRGRLTLSEIYDALGRMFPYFRTNNIGWKNSVRHNLSLHKFFERVPKENGEAGKGAYWTVLCEEYEEVQRANRPSKSREDGDMSMADDSGFSSSASFLGNMHGLQPQHSQSWSFQQAHYADASPHTQQTVALHGPTPPASAGSLVMVQSMQHPGTAAAAHMVSNSVPHHPLQPQAMPFQQMHAGVPALSPTGVSALRHSRNSCHGPHRGTRGSALGGSAHSTPRGCKTQLAFGDTSAAPGAPGAQVPANATSTPRNPGETHKAAGRKKKKKAGRQIQTGAGTRSKSNSKSRARPLVDRTNTSTRKPARTSGNASGNTMDVGLDADAQPPSCKVPRMMGTLGTHTALPWPHLNQSPIRECRGGAQASTGAALQQQTPYLQHAYGMPTINVASLPSPLIPPGATQQQQHPQQPFGVDMLQRSPAHVTTGPEAEPSGRGETSSPIKEEVQPLPESVSTRQKKQKQQGGHRSDQQTQQEGCHRGDSENEQPNTADDGPSGQAVQHGTPQRHLMHPHQQQQQQQQQQQGTDGNPFSMGLPITPPRPSLGMFPSFASPVHGGFVFTSPQAFQQAQFQHTQAHVQLQQQPQQQQSQQQLQAQHELPQTPGRGTGVFMMPQSPIFMSPVRQGGMHHSFGMSPMRPFHFQ